jgi:hypothetical protein
MTHQQPGKAGIPVAVRLAVAGLAISVSLALIWLSVTIHLERACTLMDTPYLPLCAGNESVSGTERQSNVRAHLTANPGDSDVWIRLANSETGEYEQALFHAAVTLAPSDPNVLMWRAGAALTRNDLPTATGLLVQLIEHRGKGEAADALARLVASGEGTALLRPYLATAGRWLPQVLGSITALKLPITAALPLLAGASAKGAVSQSTLQTYIRALKSDGKWADAYGLWLLQQRGPTPLLHNGAFERPFQPDGFDWEVTPAPASRAGAILSQRGSRDRGQVLEVEYTGKPVAVPVIRQYLFIPPGRYLFRGQYMTSKLRMEQGLTWAIRCSNAKSARALAGRSDGLQDTGGAWQRFQFEVVIPADCGLVASLQLETFAPFESAAGFKGRASFDSFDLSAQSL